MFYVWDYCENKVVKELKKEEGAEEYVRKQLRKVGGAYHILVNKKEVKAFKKAGKQVVLLGRS